MKKKKKKRVGNNNENDVFQSDFFLFLSRARTHTHTLCFLVLHFLALKCEIKQVEAERQKEHSNHHLTSSLIGLLKFSST